MIHYLCTALSRPGPAKKRNEDALLVTGKVYQGSILFDQALPQKKGENQVVAVADGMAGSPNSHLGSVLLLQLLGESFAKAPAATTNLRQRLLDLQHAFVDRAKTARCPGAAATLAGVVITDRQIQVFNVGDSRVYRVGNGFIRQVSCDHTELADMIEHGEIRAMSTREAPSSFLEPSSFYMADGMHTVTKVFSQTMEWDDSSAILVCTDGLVDVLDDEEIAAGATDKDSLLTLIAETRKRNGADDITVLLVRPMPTQV